MRTTSAFRLTVMVVATAAMLLSASAALSAPPAFEDTRAFGMGGTGVAAARPSGAALHNPALLAAEHRGWHDGFSLTLPSARGRFADGEDAIQQVDDIQDTVESLQSSIDANDVNQAQAQAGELADQLEAVNGDTVRGDLGTGVLLAIPRSGFSIGLHTNVVGRATVESRLSPNDITVLREIANAQNQQEFDDATAKIDTNDLDSEGRVLGSAVGEAGLTFARSFDFGGHPVSLGVTPKVVQMRTFDVAESVSGFDEASFDRDEFETEDTFFNFDIGASTDLGASNQWRFGVSVRNVIPKSLDTVDDNAGVSFQQEQAELDPRVTVGVAHRSSWHTLTVDVDATENKGMGKMADRQWAAIGAEVNIVDWFQLRAGARHNLASDTGDGGIEETQQFTGGFAFSPWALRFEVGALYSDEDLGGSAEIGFTF